MFSYEFKINGIEKHNIEIGFKTSRDYEEALDSGNLRIVFSNEKEPIQPNSLLEIKIIENTNNNTKLKTFLVLSDNVSPDGVYNYYTHNLKVIEYTYLFDNYLKNSLNFSKEMINNRSATFNFHRLQINQGAKYSHGKIGSFDSLNIQYYQNIYIPPINTKIKERYFDNETITIGNVGTGIMVAPLSWSTDVASNNYQSGLRPFIETNAPIPNNKVYINNTSVDWTLPKGNWEIRYGLELKTNPLWLDPTDPDYALLNRDYVFYTYYVNVIDGNKNSLYYIIDKIRKTISKYGGVESKQYFDNTRLFDLDPNEIEYLKGIQAPQMFLGTATVRQILVFVFNYINALPRLVKENGNNILKIERYGETNGSFIENNVISNNSTFDLDQYGTKTYSDLKNILPSDFKEYTTEIPSQGSFMNVRSESIQLTDSNFVFKLPKEKPLHVPIKLSMQIFKSINGVEIEQALDLTDYYINKSEWDIKDISSNFPSTYIPDVFSEEIGLRRYKVNNLSWQQGDTEIKMYEINGVLFGQNIIESVVLTKLRELETLNPQYPLNSGGNFVKQRSQFYYITTTSSGSWSSDTYKLLKFNLKYITIEDVNIQLDRKDIEEINFLSEIRNNQQENTLDIERSSTKIYGDLQRTGNIDKSFTRFHTTLSDMYEVGQKDINNYVITNVISTYYNKHIETTYFINKYHNRTSQATYIDQTYRWVDNYTPKALERKETYSDYIYLSESHNETNETTKIKNYNDTFNVMFGCLGLEVGSQNTKATNVIVRTDGFLEKYKDDTYTPRIVGVLAPLTSVGFKQGLLFKFGFKHNIVAGDSLNEIGGNLYNSFIQYTNNYGEFEYLDFYILNKYDLKDNELNNYPLIYTDPLKLETGNTTNDKLYFSTGTPIYDSTANDSIYIDKDRLENIEMNYMLKFISNQDFVFGINFFTDNYLVKNSFFQKQMFIYEYNNGTQYNDFEDRYVKSGWNVKRRINDRDNQQIVLSEDKRITIYNGLEDTTSWAIGDNQGNLYLASNKKIFDIYLYRTHIRKNIKVIGEV